MKKKQVTTSEPKKQQVENLSDLKKQTTAGDEVKKGYNEKNPAQPQGAFKPDSANKQD